MKKIALIGVVLFLSGAVTAQIKVHPDGDSTKTVSLEGYGDVYFGFDFNEPKDYNRPYFVTQNRHNEFNVNLAYLSLKYNSERVRATFTPGFGTYMNANYAAERQTLQNIVEANIGVKLFKDKEIWLDVGVMGAPYTTESAVSFDQLLYTRTFAAEYSPYFLTGAKLTLPLSGKVNLYLSLVNGWQVIDDINKPLAFASQFEYKPNDDLTIEWSTYVGNEQSAYAPNNRKRYFTDFYCIYNLTKKLTLSIDGYGGIQQQFPDSISGKTTLNWWQGNINARYSFNDVNSVSARAEYYNDSHSIFIVPVTGVNGFDCYSYSLCFNRFLTKSVLFRVEARYFQSSDNVFYDHNLNPVKTDMLIIGGLTAKF